MTTNQLPKNPFALLRISTDTTPQEVVECSKELIEDAKSENLEVYRKAVEQIIHHPFKRLVLAVWEMPGTDYEDHDGKWQDFANAFRSIPTISNSLRQLADTFVEKNFEPDRLLALLSPLLKVARPTEKSVFTLDLSPADDLHQPLDSNELL